MGNCFSTTQSVEGVVQSTLQRDRDLLAPYGMPPELFTNIHEFERRNVEVDLDSIQNPKDKQALETYQRKFGMPWIHEMVYCDDIDAYRARGISSDNISRGDSKIWVTLNCMLKIIFSCR